MTYRNRWFAAAAFCLAAAGAWAGQDCSDKALTPITFHNAMTTATQVSRNLDELNPQVALIARIGQDLSEYGLRYSHVGFVYREAPGQPWRLTHLLNSCGTATSDLWDEGLGNFFLEDMFSFDSLVLIPDTKTQANLWRLLHDPVALERIHSSHYNLVAYPFSTTYQNSNQWVLEVMAEAAGGKQVNSRERAQGWLKANGYTPTTLQISAIKRLGARVSKANVAFDDHPFDRRMSGQIDTVTVESIHQFMKATDLELSEREIKAQDIKPETAATANR